MSLSDDQRRLSAIVFTDMVGYTSLSQRNESRTLKLLEKHNTLIRSILKQHKCREVFFGWLRRYQLFENVRRDARFGLFLKKAGLPP